MNDKNIIIYNSPDGQASVQLLSKDGTIWMNQNQLAELFDTSVPNISMHLTNVLKEKELSKDSVMKDYLTTSTDGKKYNVTFYALPMILAINYNTTDRETKTKETVEIGAKLKMFKININKLEL